MTKYRKKVYKIIASQYDTAKLAEGAYVCNLN